MDWIKVKPNHILYEYNDLSDSEFRAWIKIMALTAQIEHEPTRDQMLQIVHYKTLDSLQQKINTRSIDLQYIVNKVLIDVQYTLNQKKYWRDQKKQKRAFTQNVPMDIQGKSHNRLDKIRLDKNIKKEKKKKIEIVLPSWIPKEPWDGFVEMRKEIKKPLTGRAIKLAITKLQELKELGNDPGKVLDQSTMSKWQGLFELQKTKIVKRFGNEKPGTTYQNTGRDIRNYKPEERPEMTEEERRRNIERAQALSRSIGTRASP
jgi:hypothetical protein